MQLGGFWLETIEMGKDTDHWEEAKIKWKIGHTPIAVKSVDI